MLSCQRKKKPAGPALRQGWKFLKKTKRSIEGHKYTNEEVRRLGGSQMLEESFTVDVERPVEGVVHGKRRTSFEKYSGGKQERMFQWQRRSHAMDAQESRLQTCEGRRKEGGLRAKKKIGERTIESRGGFRKALQPLAKNSSGAPRVSSASAKGVLCGMCSVFAVVCYSKHSRLENGRFRLLNRYAGCTERSPEGVSTAQTEGVCGCKDYRLEEESRSFANCAEGG